MLEKNITMDIYYIIFLKIILKYAPLIFTGQRAKGRYHFKQTQTDFLLTLSLSEAKCVSKRNVR